MVYIYIKKGIVISSNGSLYEGPIIHPNLRHGIGGFYLKKDKYSFNDCIRWLKLHKYKTYKCDITKSLYRWRQVEPIQLKNKKYFIKKIDNGNIMLVIAY